MSPAGRAYRSLGGVALELRKSARTRRPIPAWRLAELADAIGEAAEILNTARHDIPPVRSEPAPAQ